MNILGIDIGKRGGFAVSIDGNIEYSDIFLFDSYKKVYSFFLEIINVWKIDVIITGKINLRVQKIAQKIAYSHIPYIGIFGLLSEKARIDFIYDVSDDTMRCAVLGKGNGKNKNLVHETFKGITPDVSDAILFCKACEKIYFNS